MRALGHYFKGYITETILGPLFKLLEACFELLVPLIVARIIDQRMLQNHQNHLFQMVFLLFGLAIVGVVVAIIAQYVSSKAAIGYTQALSDALFDKIIGLSKEEHDKIGTSSLITRVMSDTYQIQTGINQFLRLFLRSPFIVFGAMLMAFTISPRLASFFVVMVLALVTVIMIISRLLSPIYNKVQQSTDRLVQVVREQLEGVRVIRAFGQTSAEIKAFQDENKAYGHIQLSASYLSSLASPLTMIIVNLTLITIIWKGNSLIENHLLSQGMMVALINYLLQILVELLKMTMLIRSLNQSRISAERVQAILEKPSQGLEEMNPTAYQEDGDDLAILVDNLTFTYPTAAKPALENISFSLKKGQSLGIIGGTGSGKSTLVHLLAHLYPAQSGQIAIYHQGRLPQHVVEWREWVALVPQRARLFQGTIRSNLTLGSGLAYSDQDYKQALSIAQAKDFVEAKEGQIDASVEAFGTSFSGGQRQRLTIARALIKKAPFLILDDASSALDFLTESRLLAALHKERKATQEQLVMVSQRTRSLKNLDKILVLEQGRLVAQGCHQELLKTCSLYREIHQSQECQEAK